MKFCGSPSVLSTHTLEHNPITLKCLEDMGALLILYAAAAVTALAFLRAFFKRSPFRHIRGPPSPSWLYGHSLATTREEDVGDLQFEYMQEYGSAWRMKECLNKDSLWVVDPKAIQYVLQTSGYHYPRTATGRHIARQIMGDSILYVEGTFIDS